MNELISIRELEGLLDRTLGGQRIEETDLMRLSFEERLWLIQRSPIRTKANLIISSPDPVRLLKKLSPQEIYLTVKESWGGDAALILEMTPPDKIVQLLDMDIWRRDRVDFVKFMEWLQLLSEGGERVLTKSLLSLDEPLLILFFKGIIEVMSRNLDQDPLELSDGGWQSFDNLYYFRPLTDEIDFDLVAGLLMQFFEYEREFYKVIMEGVKGELPSPMEEEAYQLRSFRMSSVGFPEFFEAREIFLFEDPEKIARDIRAETGKVIYLDERQAQELPPHYWLIPNTRGGFFEGLMGEAADDEEVAHLFWELSYLVHKVVAASGEDLSDTEGLVTSCQTARDYINLGLEYLAGTRHDDGKKIIREVYLVRIFRLGYMLALALKKKQEALVRRLGDIIDPALWGGLTAEVIRGLSGKRPLIYEGLVDGADGYRNFRTLADITAATDFLELLAIKVRLISEIVTIPDEIRPWLVKNARLYDWGLEHLFMTACVRACLSGVWEVAPLSEDDLRDFARLLRDNREVPDGVVSGVLEIIGRVARGGDEKLSEPAARFVRDTYEDFVRQLSAIRTPEDIDRRYITGVIFSQPL
jgi:hypothetical protein